MNYHSIIFYINRNYYHANDCSPLQIVSTLRPCISHVCLFLRFMPKVKGSNLPSALLCGVYKCNVLLYVLRVINHGKRLTAETLFSRLLYALFLAC